MDTATTNLVIGSLLGLLVSIITTLVNSFPSTNRERLADKRKASQDYFALIEKTYEDVLFLLDTELDLAMSPFPDPKDTLERFEQYSQEVRRHLARLRLLSTSDVIERFQITHNDIGSLSLTMQKIRDERLVAKEDLANGNPSLSSSLALATSMRKHLESIRQQSA